MYFIHKLTTHFTTTVLSPTLPYHDNLEGKKNAALINFYVKISNNLWKAFWERLNCKFVLIENLNIIKADMWEQIKVTCRETENYILVLVKEKIHEGTEAQASIALAFWECKTLQMSSQKQMKADGGQRYWKEEFQKKTRGCQLISRKDQVDSKRQNPLSRRNKNMETAIFFLLLFFYILIHFKVIVLPYVFLQLNPKNLFSCSFETFHTLAIELILSKIISILIP